MGLGSMKNWMGPYQRTPKEVARAIRFSGVGVRSVGPVGDFLDRLKSGNLWLQLGGGISHGSLRWNHQSRQMSKEKNGPERLFRSI